jgi:hypothetical protein
VLEVPSGVASAPAKPAMIAQRASFLPGMRASLLIAVVVLFAAAVAFTLPRPRSENQLTGLGG